MTSTEIPPHSDNGGHEVSHSTHGGYGNGDSDEHDDREKKMEALIKENNKRFKKYRETLQKLRKDPKR